MFWATTLFMFLGMLIDTEWQLVLIPIEKIKKAIEQIDKIVNNKKRKATVLQIQKLCGLLNFLCRVIVPGRLFTMNLYRSLCGLGGSMKLKPYHHVRISQETAADLRIWKLFLETPHAFSRPFMDLSGFESAEVLDWFTDAAKCSGKGVGGHHGTHWFIDIWDDEFLEAKDPSIEFMELYAVAISVLLWSDLHKTKRIVLFCDNESVIFMVNNQASKCKNCMTLIRLITLQSLISNIRIYAKHTRTFLNGHADALSRGQYDKFLKLSRDSGIEPDKYGTEIPTVLTDIPSWWLY